jgi:hypothetical protein
MALATLSIDLEARLARFEQGMNRANGMLDKLGRGASTAGQRVGEIFAGMFGAQVALEAVQRLAAAFPALVNSLDDLNDAADATGSTVENLSALEDIARRNGASLDTVTTAVVKMNQVLKDADPNSGMARALKAIGLDAAELRKQDPSEALLKVSQALAGYADNGEKARLIQALFGKSARELAPLLKDVAEAGGLVARVTTEQAAEAEKFNKALAALQTNASNAGRALVSGFLPALNQVFVILQALQQGPGLGAALFEVLKGNSFTSAQAGLEGYGAKIAEIDKQIAAIKGDKRPLIQANAAGEIAALEEQRARLQKFADAYRNILNAGSAGGGRGFVNPVADKSSVGSIPDAIPKAKAAAASFEDYATQISRTLGNLIEQSGTVKVQALNDQLAKLQELAAAGLDPQIVEDVARMLSPPLGPNAGPQISAEMERVNELLKQTDSSKLKEATRDAMLLRGALAAATPGTERWRQLQDAVLEAETAVDDLGGTFKKVGEEADDSATKMSETFEGALGDTFSRVFRGEFESIGEMWGSLLIEMASRAAAAGLMEKLFGGAGGTSGGGGSGWIAQLVGWLFSAKGNAFGPSGVIPFASGGVVSGATPFTFGGGRMGVMGEAGEEAILPLRRGRDGKLGVASQGGGGGVQIVQHINVEAGASRNEVMVAMEAARRGAVSDIMEIQRRGRLGQN